MNTYALSGFDTFRCIADACTDSCCVGWDVVIDDDTAARYRAMDTALGQKICSLMHIDEDGDTIFESVHGQCPFLRSDRLCEIQAQCGEKALSVTCARFPRIVQEFDDFTEQCLSISCPEGARITLSANRLTFPTPETADENLQLLIAIRSRLIALVQNRDVPFSVVLRQCLWYGEEMQDQLYEGEVHPDTPIEELPDGTEPDLQALFQYHKTLELMTEDFRKIEPGDTVTAPRSLLENLAVYYLYRYTLQAVEDGDLLSRVQQMLTAVTFVAFAKGKAIDVARLYSKEVEHSYENMEALYEAFFNEDALLPEHFYGIWRGVENI